MAASRFKKKMYMADKLVESVGTSLFRLSTREICILHLIRLDEYVLIKGRRNLGESRQDTAIREMIKETGIICHLLPIDLVSRVCPAIATEDVPDETRLFRGTCEPIVMQQRRIANDDVKLIWWFVAAVDEEETLGQHEKDKFEVEFYSYDKAVQMLAFEDDRELVRRAVYLVNATLSGE